MLTTRLIRSISRKTFNQCIVKPSTSQSCLSQSPSSHRHLCVSRPVQASSSPAPAKPDPQEKPASSQPDTTTVKKDPIPDVPSTSWSSFGFEEQDAKDPNKWKKFAWKYAGAVLLFMISYRTLHWYTDRLEADGKRKRKEMEEDREIAQEIRTSNPQAERFPFMEPLKDVPQLPQTSSELDELYAYKTELESNLQTLRAQGRSSEIRERTKEIESELKDLANDIRLLELKRPAS